MDFTLLFWIFVPSAFEGLCLGCHNARPARPGQSLPDPAANHLDK